MDALKTKSILKAAFKISRDIESVYLSIGDECAEEKSKLSAAIYELYENVIYPLMDECPEIRAEIESRMEATGKAFD